MSDQRARMVAKVRPRAAAATEVEIDIFDDIGRDFWTGEGTTARDVRDALKGTNPKSITLNVNTGGGDAFEGVAIHNILRGYADKGSRVIANVLGLAASAGSIVVAAADEVNVPANAAIMVHEAWSRTSGTAQDFEKHAALLRQVNETTADTYVASAARRGVQKTHDEMLELMTAETWLFGEEAVTAGLADAETPALEVAASVDLTCARRTTEMARRLPATAPQEGANGDPMNAEATALQAQLNEARAETERVRAEAAAALEMAQRAEAEAHQHASRFAQLEAERDLAIANAATVSAELNARAVQALVGVKLCPAEVDVMTRLRAKDPQMFDELIAARPELLITKDITGGAPIENAVTTDPDSKLAALVRNAGKDE